MNNLILDTHVFVWLLNGNATISTATRNIIQKTLSNGNVYISAISCWEIAMLEERKRIILTEPCLQWINEGLSHSGVQVLPLSAEISVESCNLPGNPHGDPSDKIIIASARLTNSHLITKDNAIIAYSKQHHVNVLKA